jgi:hypothetical protein
VADLEEEAGGFDGALEFEDLLDGDTEGFLAEDVLAGL